MKQTQGQRLIAQLKRRWMTYGDMLELRISTSPWKRAQEALPLGWELRKKTNDKGLVMWRVFRVRKL